MPYTPEELDNTWKEAAKTDDYIKYLEEEYQKAIEVVEIKLANLRYKASEILNKRGSK